MTPDEFWTHAKNAGPFRSYLIGPLFQEHPQLGPDYLLRDCFGNCPIIAVANLLFPRNKFQHFNHHADTIGIVTLCLPVEFVKDIILAADGNFKAPNQALLSIRCRIQDL